MKSKKILTVLSVCLAMGLTACGGSTSSKEASSQGESQQQSQPAGSQSQGGSQQSQQQSQPGSSKSSQPGTSSSKAPEKDKTGHIWGADADIAGNAEEGLAAYKRAECTEKDNMVKYTVNQSVVTYAEGSSRKSGTPEGYTKLNKDGNMMSFKFNSDKFLVGQMYLYGCMDAYSSNLNKQFCYYNGSPNIEVKVNGEIVDVTAQQNVTFKDIYGEDTDSSGNSYDNYALLGNIVIKKGVNEITYKRVQTLNILIKDFVFVGEEIDNEWGQGQDVAAKGEGYVGYKKYQSNFDKSSAKLEINALDGTFAEGSTNKSGTEEGYLKLNSNGNKISWKFNYGSAAIGQIYQVGFMDAFSSNTTKTYANTNSSDASVKTYEGNFRVTINGNIVDKSAYMDINFEDMTADGDNTIFEESKNYSPVTMCPIGNIVLKNGDNEISYERLGSFNLAVSKLVIVIRDNATEYTVEEALSHDDNTHFNKVTGTDVVFNRVEHAWEDDSSQPGTPSTCTVHGVSYVKCACGASATKELPLGDHNYTEGAKVSDATTLTCGACSSNAYELAVASPTKLKADLTWNITGLPAGNYEIRLYACAASTTLPQKFDSRYQFKVDAGEYIGASDDNATYASYGLGTGEKLENCQWSNAINTIEIGATAASFTIHWTDKGYSAFIAGVRLVKVA